MFSRLGCLFLVLFLALAVAQPGRGDPPAEGKQAAAKAPRTDLFGDPLPRGAFARLGTVRLRHPGGVSRVAFSPDGKAVASVGGDATIRLWDPKTGKEIRRCGGQDGVRLLSVVFSPDGKLLATYGLDGTARLWDTATGKERRRLTSRAQSGGLAFSPDGKTLYVGDIGTIHRWEVATGDEMKPIAVRRGGVPAIAFSRDGKILAVNGERNAILLLDAETATELRQCLGHRDFVQSLVFSSDGKTVVSTGNWPDAPRLWDVATGAEIRQFGEHGFAAAISPDGKTLAVAANDGIRRWDLVRRKPLPLLSGHPDGARSLSWSPDGKTLASGGSDGTVRLWDPARGQEVFPQAGSDAPVFSVAFSRDGKTVITGGEDRRLRFWDTSGKELRTLRHRGPIYGVAISPDGKSVAAWDGTVHLWDADTGKLLREFEGDDTFTPALAFTADGKRLAGGVGKTVRQWDAATGKELPRIKAYGAVSALAFAAGSRQLAVASAGRVDLWQPDTRELLRSWFALPRRGALLFVGFSTDGATVVAGEEGSNADLIFWDAADGTALLRMPLSDAFTEVKRVALSPDGRTLAVAADHRQQEVGGRVVTRPSLALLEVATGQVRRRLVGHEGRVRALAFAPNGTLASGADDTTVLLWEGPARPAEGARLSPREVEQRWAALAGADPAGAYDALCDLARSPREALPWLRKALPPVRAADPQRFAVLLRDLASGEFKVRDRAAAELEGLGEGAEALLHEALQKPLPLEARRRVEHVLAQFVPPKSPKRLQAVRAAELLEAIGSGEAREVLKALAGGLPEALLTREAQASVRRLAKRAEVP